jgi:hypothetical protein
MSTCLHHWICEMPNGPDTKGICKHCNEVRVFNNDERKMKTRRVNPVTGGVAYVYDIPIGKGYLKRYQSVDGDM